MLKSCRYLKRGWGHFQTFGRTITSLLPWTLVKSDPSDEQLIILGPAIPFLFWVISGSTEKESFSHSHWWNGNIIFNHMCDKKKFRRRNLHIWVAYFAGSKANNRALCGSPTSLSPYYLFLYELICLLCWWEFLNLGLYSNWSLATIHLFRK